MNTLSKDVTGKKVVLSSEYVEGTEEERVFFCKNGFGCVPFTRGSAIFGHFIKSGKEGRVEGYMIERLVEEDEKEK